MAKHTDWWCQRCNRPLVNDKITGHPADTVTHLESKAGVVFKHDRCKGPVTPGHTIKAK